MSNDDSYQHMIDALRGVAAIFVYLAHSDHARLVWFDSAWFEWVVRHKTLFGGGGVYLFFMLSGYLVWGSAKRILPSRSGGVVYLIHRSTRILPLYFICLVFCVGVLPFIQSTFIPNVSVESVLRHVFFVQSLLPSVSRDLNPVLWTLTHEAIFYLCVPFLFWLYIRIHTAGLVILFALLLIPIAWQLFGIFQPFANLFVLFFVGMLIHELPVRMSAWFPGIITVALVILGWQYDHELFINQQSTEQRFLTETYKACWALVLFLVFLYLADNERTSSKFSYIVRPLSYVGVCSFSFYMWHYILLNIFAGYADFLSTNLAPLWRDNALRAVFVTGTCISVAILSYWIFEYPAMRPLRRILLQRLGSKHPIKSVES